MERLQHELTTLREARAHAEELHNQKMRTMYTEFEKDAEQRQAQQRIQEEKLAAAEWSARAKEQELKVLNEGLEQRERSRKDQIQRLVSEVAEGLTKEKEEAIEAMRVEHERQQHRDHERRQELEAEYTGVVERLEKEKEEEGADHHEMQVKTFMQMRPLKDAVSHVDKLLFEGFGEVLVARHQMRRIGSIEVLYMIDELGMPQEAAEEAFYWAEAIRDEDLQPPQPGWARFKFAFRIDLLTTKLVVNEASDLVVSLRKRSQQARTRSKWTTKVVDDVLEYLCINRSEYLNSECPAVGFERTVWKTCANYECNCRGMCTASEEFQTLFQNGAWKLSREKGEMVPVDRLKLLLELQAKEKKEATLM